MAGIPEGYRFAARVTAGFDGGNHPLPGDLLACEACGAVILPDLRRVHDQRCGGVGGLIEERNRVAEPRLATSGSMTELRGDPPDAPSSRPRISGAPRLPS